MKYSYKLLAISTESVVNIGDYIQALAASQFLPSVDGFVERERIRDYDEEPCRMIMNGWYMHNPAQWPPSELIDPLFVALHLNSTVIDKLLSNEGVDYLKNHEPIGCRDTATLDALKSKNIEAYFSGCMTLTLGYKYHSQEKNDKVYFVDPYFITKWNVHTFVENCIYLLLYFKKIRTVSHRHPDRKKGLRKMLIVTTFFREYRKYFSDETLTNAEYIGQQSDTWKWNYNSNYERLKAAENLVKEYSKAALVVTSRIHCALPCIGLETPVVFVENAQHTEVSACRLGGLRDLFNIMRWDENQLVPEFEVSGKISASNNYLKNKTNWKPLAKSLIEKCQAWCVN